MTENKNLRETQAATDLESMSNTCSSDSSSYPKVSICIPVYNMEDTIDRAIDSALNQTYKNIEIVVADNCSTDSTVEKIKKKDTDKIRLLERDQNYGLVDNANYVADNATGEYIMLLGADDELAPDCIKQLVDRMVKYKCNAAFGKSKKIKTNGSQIISFKEHNTLNGLMSDILSQGSVKYLCLALWKENVIKDTIKKNSTKYNIRGTDQDRLFVFYALVEHGISYSLSPDVLYYKYYDRSENKASDRNSKNIFFKFIYSVLLCYSIISKTSQKRYLLIHFFPRWVLFQARKKFKLLYFMKFPLYVLRTVLGYERYEKLKSKIKQ